MRLGILLVEEVGVIRSDHLDAQLLTYLEHLLSHQLLLLISLLTT